MDVDAAFGQFDYIMAHGVYSSVPPTVRDRMMAIFKNNLTRQGVGASRILQLFDGTRSFDELVAEICQQRSPSASLEPQSSPQSDPITVSAMLKKFLSTANSACLLA